MHESSKRGNGEGSFKFDEKSGKWKGRKMFGYNAQGKPNILTVTGKTESEAKRLMREKERNSLSQQISKGNNATLIDYLNKWFETYKKPTLKQRTYESELNNIKARIESYEIAMYRISNISNDVLQNYINKLATETRGHDRNGNILKPYSRASIQKTYNLLNGCFKHAVLMKDIEKNPLETVKIPSEDFVVNKEKTIQFFNENDVELLYNECTKRFKNNAFAHRSYGLVIIFMIYTGVRIGEALALTWGDYNEYKKTISINKTLSKLTNPATRLKEYQCTTTKTRASNREIPLSQRVINVLDLAKEYKSNNPNNLIFATRNGNYLSDRNVRRKLNEIQEEVGTSIKNSGNHVCRHTFVSLCFLKEIDIKYISKWVGHKDVSTTYDIYCHIMPEKEFDVISKLDF